jgi:hypothetical protein
VAEYHSKSAVTKAVPRAVPGAVPLGVPGDIDQIKATKKEFELKIKEAWIENIIS